MPPRAIWRDPPVDGGYTGRLVEWAKEKLALAVKVVKRSDDVSGFVVLPRRWVVERTLHWLMRSRRLARDYERRPETGETFILWSVTMVMSRCLARRYSPAARTGRGGLSSPALTGVRSARTAGHGTSWRIRTATSSALWPRPTPTGRSQNTAGPYRGPRQLAVTALRWPVPRGWRPRRPAGPSRSSTARTGSPTPACPSPAASYRPAVPRPPRCTRWIR